MLDPSARAALLATRFGDVVWLSEVGSTNDEVARQARDGAAEGVVVAADVQTAGRGRWGRTWEAPRGSSLLVSVLLRPPAAHLGLVAAGLAAQAACHEVARVDARLKWPNDLVAEGRGKLAGILAEAPGGGAGGVVVGLGLNVDWGVAPLPAGATALAELSPVTVDRGQLLVAYLLALEDRCRQDAGSLMADYRAACSTIGHRVRVALPGGGTRVGVASTVDDDGRLIVDGHPVAAGDVAHVADPADPGC